MDNNQPAQSPVEQTNPILTPNSTPTSTYEPPKSSWMKWALFIVLAILLSSGTTYFILNFNSQLKTPQSSTYTPSPTPSPISVDETANWKTYTNSFWGFQVKYPPEKLKICEGFTPKEEGVRFWPLNFNCLAGDTIYIIGVTGNRPGEYTEYKNPASTEKIKLNGISATKKVYIYDETDGPLFPLKQSTEVIVETEKGIIQFQLAGNNPENTTLFNQILSTFKFLE